MATRRALRRFSAQLLPLLLAARHSYQQEDDGSDEDDDGGSDDTYTDDDDDDCSLISGHSCNANGICKYCAMCLQSSCILSKSVSTNTSLPAASSPVCNTTQFGSTDIYDWYGYCLSSGNDLDGDYCATSSECYQYRRNANSSVSHIWNNLTCEPTSCLLMTDRGQPPPAPGQLPPDDPGKTHHAEGGAGDNDHHSQFSLENHSPAAIALTIVCSLILIGGIVWLARTWMRSRYARPPFSWLALCKRRKKRVQSLASDTTLPSTAPPSFSSNAPEMQQQRRMSTPNSIHSQYSRSREPLPSYFSPDPPPPKYEQAIVTQIRGLLQSNVEENDDGEAGHNSLPPPLWLPVYFTPNHSAYSFGRLRRHPPPTPAAGHPSSSSAVASSSSSASPHPRHYNQSPVWHHNNDWSDPLQAFWYHHQQQMNSHVQPTPSSSSPPELSRRASGDGSAG